MHNHNHQGGHDSKMMWLMMLACLLPAIIVLFSGNYNSSNSFYLIAMVAVMIGLHWYMMRSNKTAAVESGQQIDPVCGMALATSEVSSEHEGKKYLFCSAGCQLKFAADPKNYLSKVNDKSSGKSCCH